MSNAAGSPEHDPLSAYRASEPRRARDPFANPALRSEIARIAEARAQTDLDIAARYVRALVPEDSAGLFEVIRAEHARTVEEVLLRTTRLRDGDGTLWHFRNGEIMSVGNRSQPSV